MSRTQSRRPRLLAARHLCWILSIALILPVSSGLCGELKYIYGTRRGLFFNQSGRAIGNMPWQILRLDESRDSLVVEFSIEPEGWEPFGSMYYYPELDLFLVADGGGVATSYRAISPSEQRVTATLRIDSTNSHYKMHLFTTPDSTIVLRLYRFNVQERRSEGVVYATLSEDSKVTKLDTNDLKLHLAGSKAPYMGSSDVLTLDLVHDSQFVSRDSLTAIDLPPVPRGLIQATDIHVYNLIALNDEYAVVLVVPVSNEYETTEILLNDLKDGDWRSIQLPGSQTTPLFVNNLLVGTVADRHPATALTVYHGGAPILSGDAVILYPQTGDMRTVALGPECEILWIRGDTITYRTLATLEEGIIGEDSNVRVLWSLEDIRVIQIHWAYWSE